MAIDPQQLATEQTQRSAMDAAGSPTSFAKGPQVAGPVDWAAVGQLLNKMPKDSSTADTIFGSIGNVIKGKTGDEATPPEGSNQAVPTPVEESAALKDGTQSYQQIQRMNAPRLLSPEGQVEFQRRGFSAFPDQSDSIIGEADEALRNEAAEQAEEARKLAKLGLTQNKQGYLTSGLAPEAKADAVLERIAKHEVEMKSLVANEDFNFQYIETAEEVRDLINTLSDVYSDEQVAVTRGNISNKTTEETAREYLKDELGFSRTLINRKIGDDPMGAAKTLAARELLTRSAVRLIEAAEVLVRGEGDNNLRLRFRRQMAIHAGIQLQVKGSITELGRAMQSMKITVTGDESVAATSNAVNKLLAETGGPEVADELARKILEVGSTKGPAGINRFVNTGALAKTKDVIHEAYLVGLLSNTSTQIKNLAGNMSFMLYQVPAEIMAAAYGAGVRSGRRALKFDIPEDQVEAADALLRVKGWMDSFKDAWVAGAEAYRTELPGQKPSKLDVDNYAAISADPNSVHGAAINELGKRIRIPFRLLLAGDEFFKTIASRGELYTRVNGRFHQMMREGKTQQEAMDEAGMMLLDPRAISEEIDEKALYDTMQTRIAGLDEATSFIQRSFLGRFVIPFATAPTNSMFKLLEFSPVGAAASLVRRNVMPESSKYSISSKKHQQQMGRAMLGSGTMLLMSQYALEGRLTGSMPRDKDAREDFIASGKKPYSFVFKAADWPTDANGDDLPMYNYYGRPNGNLVYVNYAAIEPIGAIIGIAADYAQKVSELPDDADHSDRAATAVAVTTDYYRELPMLQGVSDLVKLFENTDRIDLLVRSFSESQSLIPGVPNPLSSLQRAIMDVYDPTKTRPRGDIEYYGLDHAIEMGKIDGMAREQNLKGISSGVSSDGTPFDLADDPDLLAEVGTAKGSGLYKALQDSKALRTKDSIFVDERELNAVEYDTLGNVKSKTDLSLANRPIAAIRNRFMAMKIEEGLEVKEGSVEDELMKLHHFTGEWPLTDYKKTISLNGVSVPIGFGVQSEYTNYVKNKHEMFMYGTVFKFKEALNYLLTMPDYAEQGDFGIKVALIKSLETDYYNDAVQSFLENTNKDGSPAHTRMAPQILQALEDKLAAKNTE